MEWDVFYWINLFGIGENIAVAIEINDKRVMTYQIFPEVLTQNSFVYDFRGSLVVQIIQEIPRH